MQLFHNTSWNQNVAIFSIRPHFRNFWGSVIYHIPNKITLSPLDVVKDRMSISLFVWPGNEFEIVVYLMNALYIVKYMNRWSFVVFAVCISIMHICFSQFVWYIWFCVWTPQMYTLTNPILPSYNAIKQIQCRICPTNNFQFWKENI